MGNSTWHLFRKTWVFVANRKVGFCLGSVGRKWWNSDGYLLTRFQILGFFKTILFPLIDFFWGTMGNWTCHLFETDKRLHFLPDHCWHLFRECWPRVRQDVLKCRGIYFVCFEICWRTRSRNNYSRFVAISVYENEVWKNKKDEFEHVITPENIKWTLWDFRKVNILAYKLNIDKNICTEPMAPKGWADAGVGIGIGIENIK